MKKWNYLLSMFLIAGTVLVTSCSKDEDDPPTLDLKGTTGYTSSDATISVDETILVGVIAAAGTEKLSSFNLTVRHNNVDEFSFDTTLNADNFNMDFEIPFSAEFIGTNLVTMKVVDKGGSTAQQSFTITVESGAVPVNKYSGIEFGSHNDAVGSFYNSEENAIYTIGTSIDNQAKVDFIYYYGDTHGNTIAAPDDEIVATITTFGLDAWTTKNATRFKADVMTAAQFDLIGDDYEFPTFDGDAKYIDQLEVDDVIYFKTAAGKLGLIKVVSVTTPNRGDRATFDIIVQE